MATPRGVLSPVTLVRWPAEALEKATPLRSESPAATVVGVIIIIIFVAAVPRGRPVELLFSPAFSLLAQRRRHLLVGICHSHGGVERVEQQPPIRPTPSHVFDGEEMYQHIINHFSLWFDRSLPVHLNLRHGRAGVKISDREPNAPVSDGSHGHRRGSCFGPLLPQRRERI
jgi:hypothetical protein